MIDRLLLGAAGVSGAAIVYALTVARWAVKSLTDDGEML